MQTDSLFIAHVFVENGWWCSKYLEISTAAIVTWGNHNFLDLGLLLPFIKRLFHCVLLLFIHIIQFQAPMLGEQIRAQSHPISCEIVWKYWKWVRSNKDQDPTISPAPAVLPITKKIHMGSSTNSLTRITRLSRKFPLPCKRPLQEGLPHQAAFEDQHQPRPPKSDQQTCDTCLSCKLHPSFNHLKVLKAINQTPRDHPEKGDVHAQKRSESYESSKAVLKAVDKYSASRP